MLRRLVPYLAYAYLTFVGWTNSLRLRGNSWKLLLRGRGQRFIYALWHERQVYFTWTHRDDGAAVLVSLSGDGDIIAKVMDLSRIAAPRGSSSRGASAALRAMIKMLADGYDIGLTPDGPKGPRRTVKPGAAFLAQKLGVPLLPIANALSKKLIFPRSWDQYQVPLPFGRSVVHHGKPVWVGPDDDLGLKAAELKAELDRVTDAADREVETASGGSWVRFAVLASAGLLAPLVGLGIILKFLLSTRRGLLKTLPRELRERLGYYRLGELAPLSGRPVAWLHAASAGEVAALAPLVERIKCLPGSPGVVMTTTTAAGRERARALPGVDLSFLAPMDARGPVRRAFTAFRAYVLIVAETELWPTLLDQAERGGVPVALVNGRLSDRSFSSYRRFSALTAPFLSRLDAFAVQTAGDAERFEALGADPSRIVVTGNMKHDRPLAPADSAAARAAVARLGWSESPIFVAGSTHAGLEEDAVLDAFLAARRAEPALRLMIAPRHPERAGRLEEVLRRRKISFVRWTNPDFSGESPSAAVINVMGVLPSLYPLARVSFVGGSLAPAGGHNLLEPALAGSPVLFGPHVSAARESADALTASGGGRLAVDALELAAGLTAMLGAPGGTAALGSRAREAALGLAGATARTQAHLGAMLEPPRFD